MVNTIGLTQYAIISALEYVAGRKLWYLPAQNGCCESWACVGPDGEWVQVFLAPEGFDESLFDIAFGYGAAQRAIDRAKGGAATETRAGTECDLPRAVTALWPGHDHE